MLRDRKFAVCVISIFACMAHVVAALGANCIPANLYPGSSCYTFYKCVEGRFFTHKWEFTCPPGTIFSAKDSLCISDEFEVCLDDGPQPPDPEKGSPGLTSPVGALPPGSIGPPGHPASPPGTGGSPSHQGPLTAAGPPGSTEPGACPVYELDPTSQYECLTPKTLPYPGGCKMFVLCINTMQCIIKGFLVKCPENHLFSREKRECVHQEKASPCPFLQDGAATVIEKKPSITLKTSNMKKFFKVKAVYWKLKKFLPEQRQQQPSVLPQRQPSEEVEGPPLRPADVAKGLSRDKSRVIWNRGNV